MHVVPSKATSMDKFAAERIVEDIVYLGHTRVILRSDNKPALLLLVSDALKGSVCSSLSRQRPRALYRTIHRRQELPRCPFATSNAKSGQCT